MQALARAAVAKCGRIDVWINNAGVYLVGRFEDCPADVFRRVLDTNFFGTVHGARAALQQFRKQRRGILVNVDSVVASAPQPYTSAYVEVCTILPASIDTPLFSHTANYLGRKVKAMSPVNRPEVVARAVAGVIERPRRETLVGRGAKPLGVQSSMMPGAFEKLAPHFYDRGHFSGEPAPRSEGNLFEPDTGNTNVSGGWKKPPSRVRRGVLAAIGTAAVTGAVVAAARTMRGR